MQYLVLYILVVISFDVSNSQVQWKEAVLAKDLNSNF